EAPEAVRMATTPRETSPSAHGAPPTLGPAGRFGMMLTIIALLAALPAVYMIYAAATRKPESDNFADSFAKRLKLAPLMAVQDDGRIKTLDTVAAGMLSAMHGSPKLRESVLTDKSLAGHDALATLLDLHFEFPLYYNERIIHIKNPGLRTRLIEELANA